MRTIELRQHRHAKPLGRPDAVHVAVCDLMDAIVSSFVGRGGHAVKTLPFDIIPPFVVSEGGLEVNPTPAETARVQGALMEAEAVLRKISRAL